MFYGKGILSFLGPLQISIQSISSYLSCLEAVSSACILGVQTNIGWGLRTECWERYLYLRGRKWQGVGESHLIRNVKVCTAAVLTAGAAEDPSLLGCRSGNSPRHFPLSSGSSTPRTVTIRRLKINTLRFLSPSSVQVRNEWSCTSTRPNWFHGMYRGYLTFALHVFL
jgi:hypothetical protein